VGRFEDEGWRVRKDGTRFFANVVITALRDSDSTLRGFAKVTRDISERKAHEERIERLTRELEGRVVQLAATNRELEQKSAENESFVYSVSHDLRSPLVNLQGFSQELALSATSLETLLERSARHFEARRSHSRSGAIRSRGFRSLARRSGGRSGEASRCGRAPVRDPPLQE